MKKTVVFDFDGVIHSYKSGWKGASIIPDPPVAGMPEAIQAIRKHGYEVVVVSTRTATEEGINGVRSWLDKYGIIVDRVCSEKPPAYVYVDDRAIRFDGNASTLLPRIDGFKTWMEAEDNEAIPLVNVLREDAEWAHANEWETPITLGDNLDAAANLIESLSAQLDQVTRERDAAVYMLDGECYACAHNSCGEPSREKEVCRTCLNNEDAWWGYELEDSWQWRGVEVEE